MPRKRAHLRVLGLVALGATLLAVPFAACNPDTARVGAGGECFVATDCEQGLVCVPQQNGSRVCSNDLSRISGRPPPEAGPRDAVADADDAAQDAPEDAPIQETGTDTGADTGPVDSGADG